jgi:tyrosine-specific transport protein
LLILEATLWFDQRVNLISMAGFALGKAGKALTWSLFLFLFYCLFVAYIDGGGQLFSNMLSPLFSLPIARGVGIVCCVAFVGLIVYGGTRAVSYVNRLVLIGLTVSFCILLSLGVPHIKIEKLQYTDWEVVYSTIPIIDETKKDPKHSLNQASPA